VGSGVGTKTLNCIQHGDWIGEPRADPARNPSLDIGGRNALILRFRPNAPRQQ